MTEHELTRRRLLELGVAVVAGVELFRSVDRAQGAPLLAATPTIADADEPTPALTEGPYFKPRSPLRRSIAPKGVSGTPLTLTGRVLNTAGKPVAHALVDFWQADARGVYDNTGYRFRGHQFSDAKGRYRLLSVVPGIYPGRTKHIHVKVQAPHRSVLTTQLFFPGVARNRSDGIYTAECLVRGWRVVRGRRLARFDFVLDI